MFDYKYVAINNLTGIEIKRFRTAKGALRWYKKPQQLMWFEFSKSDLGIDIYSIAELQAAELERVVEKAVENAVGDWTVELNARAAAQAEADQEEEEYDERCSDKDCLFCYGTQEEYEAYQALVAAQEAQPELPLEEEQPMPAWERELLKGFSPSYIRGLELSEPLTDEEREQREAERLASDEALASLRQLLSGIDPRN